VPYCISDVKVTQERASSNVEKKKGQKREGKRMCACACQRHGTHGRKRMWKKVKKEGVPVLARGMELTEGKDPGRQCAFCYRLWSEN
jgi:hypothetical protein